jgi:BirA family biotin operon repressor/biotin-[acetyl-CoA-carboxylase] ligase
MGLYTIVNLVEIDSTNSYVLRELDTLGDRSVILAERQTAGHGRLSRKWVSDVPRNIYMSLVLKPQKRAREYSHLKNLTQYMSIVLCEVLKNYNVEADLKWPNDVLVKGKKIAGLLGEAKFRNERFIGYVLGIGVNLNMDPQDLVDIDQPATSLNLLTGKNVDRDNFISQLLERFFKGYPDFLHVGFPLIKKNYTDMSTFLSKKITVVTFKETIIGTALDFTANGSLMLRTDDGREKILTVGDIVKIKK